MLQRELAIGGVSICPSVRLSVTRWYRLKTNDRRIVRFSPSGLLFWCQLSYPRFTGNPLQVHGEPPCEGFKQDWSA